MSISTSDIPVLDIDPYTDESILNPLPLFELLRDSGPVVYLSRYATYAAARFEECAAVLEDWRSFTSETGVGLSDLRKPGGPRPLSPITEVDPPEHDAIRTVMNRVLSPRILRGWKEDFDRYAEKLVDVLLQKSSVDGVKDIAEPYVTTVFPSALGWQTYRENFIVVGNFAGNMNGPLNDRYLASKQALDALGDWYMNSQQRDNLVPGGFGSDLFAAEDRGDLPEGLAARLMGTLLRAGMDTTISSIGFSLQYLATEPGLWSRVREDRKLLRLVLEETLRLETPFASYYRATGEDVVLGGVPLDPGVKIHIFPSAGNRDPRKWDNADAFDIGRANLNHHLSFGKGVHNCVGQMVARLEYECLMNKIADRITEINLDGKPVPRMLNNLRTLDALPLVMKGE